VQLGRIRLRSRMRASSFSPVALFAGGVQGAWYDPSDFSTLFQNSAGTTPVTAVEQPVGYMADKSGRGNHATQATSASRPTLRARYNQLTFSEQFDNAAWTKVNATVTANAAVAPDGTTTADLLVEDAATGVHNLTTPTLTLNSGAIYHSSIYAKPAGRSWVCLQFSGVAVSGTAAERRVWFNVATGQIGTTGALWSNVTISDAGNGFYRCSAQITQSGSANLVLVLICDADNSVSYTGDNTSGLYIWGAQLLTAADQTTTAGAYQRIAAATDYATGASFPPYLAFDGVDDTMTISSGIHGVFQNVGGGTMWAGYGNATVADHNIIAVANNATFSRAVLATDRAGGRRLDADTFANATDSGWVAGGTYVATNVSDWAGGNVIRRTNGAQVASAAYSSGAGNTSNTASSAAYLFTNPSATVFALGRLYSAIILGRTATAAELTSTENWINGKARAY
jgi:hypothetical protein